MAESNVGRVRRVNPISQAQQQLKNQNTDVKSVDKPTDRVEKRQNDVSKLTGGVYEPVLITETCHLPSKGIPYGKALGDTVQFRAMTTVEERMRLSGENFWSTMAAILNRCKVGTDFDMKNLVDFDFYAAIVKLRTISYGNNYKTRSKCMVCGLEQEVDVNLDEVSVTELPKDFVEPFKVGPLPISGDILECRFLRVFDYIDISNKMDEWRSKHPNDRMNSPEYTLLMEHAIVTINGAELNEFQKKAYVESMIGADSTFYHDALNDMFYGVHRIGTAKCKEPDCDSYVLYEIAPSDSFFRATPILNKRTEPQNDKV